MENVHEGSVVNLSCGGTAVVTAVLRDCPGLVLQLEGGQRVTVPKHAMAAGVVHMATSRQGLYAEGRRGNRCVRSPDGRHGG